MSKPARSPVARNYLIGSRMIRRVIAGEIACPYCDRPVGGIHCSDCLIGEALVLDPVYLDEARAAKEGNRG